MDITRRLAVAPYSRLNLSAWTQALTQATPTFPGSFQVNSWCAKQPQGSFLRALLEAAWSLWESGYLWHLKAALIPDLSFAAFSGRSLPPAPLGPELAGGLQGERRYPCPLPAGVNWGLGVYPGAGGATGVSARAERG